MRLVQARIVTADVAALASFYACLVGVPVAVNEYYVEVPAGAVTVGFSRHRFTEYRDARAPGVGRRDEVMLDFQAPDVDAEYGRIAGLGVPVLLPPTTQPWGSRSMVFRDPGGTLVNVFSRPGAGS
jgi:predicted enzyme related to lactoylglutathione lyase